MSTAPMTGMSLHAHASGMPKIPKYGTQAALVIKPKAPWPMKQAATATRRIQCSVTVSSSLLGRQEIELRHALAHLAPEGHPVLAGAAEMDAGIDARVRALAGRLGEARERPRDPLERLAARDGEAGLIAAQGAGERHGRRRA